VVESSATTNDGEPPSSEEATLASHPTGFGVEWRWFFLEALFEGLLDHDRRKGGSGHAPTPVPAA